MLVSTYHEQIIYHRFPTNYFSANPTFNEMRSSKFIYQKINAKPSGDFIFQPFFNMQISPQTIFSNFLIFFFYIHFPNITKIENLNNNLLDSILLSITIQFYTSYEFYSVQVNFYRKYFSKQNSVTEFNNKNWKRK